MPEPLVNLAADLDPANVPEPLVRALGIVLDFYDATERVQALIEELSEVLPALGLPRYRTDEENNALYARAEALRGDDA